MAYRVIIIEDDPMVAAIDRQYVESDPRFTVDQTLKGGGEALALLGVEEYRADLIILDYYTPSMNGLEFVDRLHAMGRTTPVIMVTSAGDRAIVQAMVARGVLDYLVKPFEFSRFRQALDKFVQFRAMLDGGRAALDQQAIDQLLRPGGESGPQLSKGLNGATLERVRAFLAAHRGASFTTEEIAEQVGLSRITIRRYVNHMVEAGELVSDVDYQTGGRPSLRYTYTRLD